MLLPQQFWVQHSSPPWRGGVEKAFMSTTADKAVAFYYANGRGTVVEISVGRIQIGGDVSFLSMVSPPPCPFFGSTVCPIENPPFTPTFRAQLSSAQIAAQSHLHTALM